MKKLNILPTLFLAVLFALNPGIYSQTRSAENTFIKEDSMNLAIFVVDFLSYEFIEANISYYALCDACDQDSLPMSATFVYPMDFGDIAFNYAHDNAQLFHGAIVWAGLGEISHPEPFLPASLFEHISNPVSLQEDARYFDYWLIPQYCSKTIYRQKADSAWLAINQLSIVKEFADRSYYSAFYAYTPSVGFFNPNEAKWIIFLYSGNNDPIGTSKQLNDVKHFGIYPNPNKGLVNISNYLPYLGCSYEIINAQSNIVRKGQITGKTISLSELENGLYVLRIWTGKEYLIRKLFLSI